MPRPVQEGIQASVPCKLETENGGPGPAGGRAVAGSGCEGELAGLADRLDAGVRESRFQVTPRQGKGCMGHEGAVRIQREVRVLVWGTFSWRGPLDIQVAATPAAEERYVSS